ncbi:MAG: hypothetical protein MZV49_13345 [Rhodopseudomonas palustris]|nr:hypothetical protein [Rhodopseudomonas palustris]
MKISAELLFAPLEKLLVPKRAPAPLVPTNHADFVIPDPFHQKRSPVGDTLTEAVPSNQLALLDPQMMTRTAVRPVFGIQGKPRTDRIPLDVPNRREQMRLVERERRVPALPGDARANPPGS